MARERVIDGLRAFRQFPVCDQIFVDIAPFAFARNTKPSGFQFNMRRTEVRLLYLSYLHIKRLPFAQRDTDGGEDEIARALTFSVSALVKIEDDTVRHLS